MKKGENMKPTITSGKHFANHCKMTGSRFEDVCLGDAEFDNVSLAGAKFHNINFSDAIITAANFGGVTFKHIGPAPDETGAYPPQKLVLFTEADFNGSEAPRPKVGASQKEDYFLWHSSPTKSRSILPIFS